ncbi:hypothetical protein [Pontibacillus salipaludis]|nr:hypothetical protein [Pontibacillus salipaludis]
MKGITNKQKEGLPMLHKLVDKIVAIVTFIPRALGRLIKKIV